MLYKILSLFRKTQSHAAIKLPTLLACIFYYACVIVFSGETSPIVRCCVVLYAI